MKYLIALVVLPTLIMLIMLKIERDMVLQIARRQ